MGYDGGHILMDLHLFSLACLEIYDLSINIITFISVLHIYSIN